jgi:hypothetical protein
MYWLMLLTAFAADGDCANVSATIDAMGAGAGPAKKYLSRTDPCARAHFEELVAKQDWPTLINQLVALNRATKGRSVLRSKETVREAEAAVARAVNTNAAGVGAVAKQRLEAEPNDRAVKTSFTTAAELVVRAHSKAGSTVDAAEWVIFPANHNSRLAHSVFRTELDSELARRLDGDDVDGIQAAIAIVASKDEAMARDFTIAIGREAGRRADQAGSNAKQEGSLGAAFLWGQTASWLRNDGNGRLQQSLDETLNARGIVPMMTGDQQVSPLVSGALRQRAGWKSTQGMELQVDVRPGKPTYEVTRSTWVKNVRIIIGYRREANPEVAKTQMAIQTARESQANATHIWSSVQGNLNVAQQNVETAKLDVDAAKRNYDSAVSEANRLAYVDGAGEYGSSAYNNHQNAKSVASNYYSAYNDMGDRLRRAESALYTVQRQAGDAESNVRSRQWDVESLTNRLATLPAMIDVPIEAPYSYEVDRMTRTANRSLEVRFHSDAVDRTLRASCQNQTIDDTHPAHVKEGISGDPLQYPKPDATLVHECNVFLTNEVMKKMEPVRGDIAAYAQDQAVNVSNLDERGYWVAMAWQMGKAPWVGLLLPNPAWERLR